MGLGALLTKDASLRYGTSTSVDDRGHPVVTASLTSVKCYPRQASTRIEDVGRVETSELTIVVPPSTTLEGLLGLSIDGEDYLLSGVPHRQWNPRTRQVEYVLLRVRRAVS